MQAAVVQLPADNTLPDRVRSLFAYTSSSLLGNLIGAVVLVLLFDQVVPTATLWLWVGLFLLVFTGRGALAWRFGSARLETLGDHRRWLYLWNFGTLASGAAWGLSAWLFYGYGQSIQRVALILIIYSYCVGAIPLLATQYKVFLSFAALCFVPTIARIVYMREPYSVELAGVMMLIFGMTSVLGRNYRAAFDRVVQLKVHADRLMEQLRTEKTAADEARRQAEVANRAKTQFFAAASHDLRQPLHALGLFAEALRQKSRNDGEVSQLVNSINSSVDALEGLFSELLDITRIDTGGVDSNPQDFSVRDMFGRLRLTFEPTAFEKGLALDFRGERHFAHADPLLVERILRNLVSNAIRYTEDGGILVSCRTSGGQLKLQVWDTGVGIAEKERGRIFEEFYQVQGGRPLEAHHRKGLGLGLAIVKRLADLMRAPLSVRSVPGRGSVFTLLLPIGAPPRITGPAAAPKGPIGLTLDHRLIVVVEDEPAVSEAIEVLLKGWGASVVSFDSVANARSWALAQDPQRVKPDLLMVDYRLPEGGTGIDAIVALRGHFGPVPAIMVTGSTLSGFEEDAQRHDFHLLVKPVVPNKLRAMIAFKLGVR